MPKQFTDFEENGDGKVGEKSQPEMDEQKQILRLATEIANMDLAELVEGWRRRLLIMDSQIEALRQEREALAQERHKLRAEREQLHALYHINLRVLNIVNRPDKTGENNETDFVTRFTQ